jgi:hypothetical protein
MCEYTWWYLYVQLLNEEVNKKNEINRLIETLLPWINPELWSEYQKQQDKGQENVAFDSQVQSMFQGTFDTDPNAPVINLDEFEVSDAAKQRVVDQQPQQSGSGSTVSQMFDQYKASIQDQLFPDQGPSFRGNPEDLPPEYKDFYKNTPTPEDFPPEKPPEKPPEDDS